MYLKLKMLFNHQPPIENIVKKQYLNVFNDFIKIVNVFRKKCPLEEYILNVLGQKEKNRKDKLSCFTQIGCMCHGGELTPAWKCLLVF